MKDRKRVLAILMPFYGIPEILRKSLLSLAQETLDHDVVIVDDGNPSPLAIPADWHPSVTVVRHESNRGITAALNTGLEHILRANYRYVARLDAGDINVLGRLEKQVAFLEHTPECKLVGGYGLSFAEDGRPLFPLRPPCTWEAIRRAMHRQCCIIHPSVMFRADVFAEVGGYREMYPAAEDYDLFFRIVERFYTVNIPEILVEFEKGRSTSISRNRRRAQVMSRIRIVLSHFDLALPQSYQGLVEGLISLMLPQSATTRLREFQARLARASTVN